MKHCSRGGVTDELLGTWVFNDTISLSTNTYQLTFQSSENTYNEISVSAQRDIIQYDSEYAYMMGWSGASYKTITITDTSNLTNREAFTTWLKANATKQ